MGYVVIKHFFDLQDKKHEYQVGDIFPHHTSKVTKKRLAELSSDRNRQGVPLIREVKEDADADLSGTEELV